MREFGGIPAASGYAVGPVHVVRKREVSVARRTIRPEEVPSERARFETAVDRARAELEDLVGKLERELGPDEASILASQLLMLEDEMIWDATLAHIRTDLINAEAALSRAVGDIVLQFDGVKDRTLRERIADLHDLEARVLQAFGRGDIEEIRRLDVPSLIASRDLTPSETAALERENILGFVMDEGGSSTSHVAILARSLGVPAVVGLGGEATRLQPGETVAVDGAVGWVIVDPDPATRERFLNLKQQQITVSAKLDYLRDLPAETPDGRRVKLLVNIELPVELDSALARGAEGIGLLRTEYLYFQHRTIPSEEDQVATYVHMLKRMGGRPVIFRTLDVGGDKVSEYLGARREYNPFLGWRGIRFSLANRTLFKTQIRALYRAAAVGPAAVMFPMITGVEELRAAREVCEEARAELVTAGIEHGAAVPIGLMIETPSAAAVSDLLARESDFFSIGSNDLIQYTLAMDRGNSRVSYLYRPLHPAILRLIHGVVEAGRSAGIPVGLCGEMASETRLAEVLLGLGLDELSLHSAALPKIKQVIRWTPYAEAERVAAHLMTMATADETDRWLADYVETRKRERYTEEDPES